MPSVRIVRQRLTSQMRKYSRPLPVKVNRRVSAGATSAGEKEGSTLVVCIPALMNAPVSAAFPVLAKK